MTLQEAGAVIDLNLTIAAGMKVNLLMQNLKDVFEIDIDENQTIDDLRELAKVDDFCKEFERALSVSVCEKI